MHDVAAEAGRDGVRWQHALQLWAGFGASREEGRQRVSRTMSAAYALPFDRFERYVPCGSPEAVADALAPYLEVGLPPVQLRARGDEPAGRRWRP